MRFQVLLIGGLVLGIFGVAWGSPVWIAGQSATPIAGNDSPFVTRIIANDVSGITVEVQFHGLELEATSGGTFSPVRMKRDYIQPGNLPHLPQWSTWVDVGRDNGAV